MTIHLDHQRRLKVARTTAEVCVFAFVALTVAASAVIAKQAAIGPALVAIDTVVSTTTPAPVEQIMPIMEPMAMIEALQEPAQVVPSDVRFFDGRPVKPIKTIWMTVTAYSPDHRSCGSWADGKTATNDSVWTNAMQLVAADTRILPFGSMITVPGYADNEIVPILDRGGAIKGARLDVLYATHSRARQWGVQKLPVIVWGYTDDPDTDR